MQVTLRLRKLLAEYGLDRHGIIQDMASDIGVERHTLNKLFKQRPATISLALLSKVCTWLEMHDVPGEILPGAFFTTGLTKLWEAIARTQHVTLYLGEYHSSIRPAVANRWIASSDALVEAHLIQHLSKVWGRQRAGSPSINPIHIPFRFVSKDEPLDSEQRAADIANAERHYAQIKTHTSPGTIIIIGSQRANYLLELFVADLFGCKPFTPPAGEGGKVKVPFFSVYRTQDRYTPSAFGGDENPFRQKDRKVPGLHYLNKGKWATCPWVEGQEDAGLIITRWDHTHKAITLAIVGFTGKATEILGSQLINKEERFWPPATEMRGMDLGIYLCKLTHRQRKQGSSTQCDVIPLGDQTVARRVS